LGLIVIELKRQQSHETAEKEELHPSFQEEHEEANNSSGEISTNV
jgi:hypothetical protein